MESYTVYVQTNDAGYITAINSSDFLTDLTGWTKIDEGAGDKFHHAQGNYFSGPIFTEGGACCYKLVDGAPAECTAEEVTAQEAETESVPTLEDRLDTMEEALEMILSGVTE